MSTNAKIGIAVGALVALVFAVTIISTLPKPPDDTNDPNGSGGVEPPKEGLVAAVQQMRYAPTSGRAELREYPMYYERGDLTVPFWVKNRNTVPITVRFGYTSCEQCSLAEVAVVPSFPFDPSAEPEPFAAVFGGIAGKPGLGDDDPPFGLNETAYRARKKIEAAIPVGDWKRLKPPRTSREDLGTVVNEAVIPAAPSPDKPVWAIIRLNVRLSNTKILETRFDCSRPDSPLPLTLPFLLDLRLVEPCELYPPLVDFKTIPDGAQTAEETVYFFSYTRGLTLSPDGLLDPLPKPDVDAVRAPHISFSPPVPATPEELAVLALRKQGDPKDAPAVRVTAAYKTTLRFSRTATVNDKPTEIDLGPYEREVGLPAAGRGVTLTKTPVITVRANVLGAVQLPDGPNVKGDKIDLGAFSVRNELVRDVSVVTEKPGLELETVPDQTMPKYLKLDPTIKAEKKGDRTRWTFTLRIDKDVGGGELRNGSVVLRIKGTGQLVRVPVVGRGTS